MKYIKTFESLSEFYSIPEEIQDQIKDIFLDLTDRGFNISYVWSTKFNDNYGSMGTSSYAADIHYGKNIPLIPPSIMIRKGLGTDSFFHNSEIKEVVDRLKDYLIMQEYDMNGKEIASWQNWCGSYQIEIIKR